MVLGEAPQHCKDLIVPPAFTDTGPWQLDNNCSVHEGGSANYFGGANKCNCSLPPSLEIGVCWQGISGGTKSKLVRIWWKSLQSFYPQL